MLFLILLSVLISIVSCDATTDRLDASVDRLSSVYKQPMDGLVLDLGTRFHQKSAQLKPLPEYEFRQYINESFAQPTLSSLRPLIKKEVQKSLNSSLSKRDSDEFSRQLNTKVVHYVNKKLQLWGEEQKAIYQEYKSRSDMQPFQKRNLRQWIADHWVIFAVVAGGLLVLSLVTLGSRFMLAVFSWSVIQSVVNEIVHAIFGRL